MRLPALHLLDEMNPALPMSLTDHVNDDTEIDQDGYHLTVYESNVDDIQIVMNPSEDEVRIDVSYRSKTDHRSRSPIR